MSLLTNAHGVYALHIQQYKKVLLIMILIKHWNFPFLHTPPYSIALPFLNQQLKKNSRPLS